MKFILFHTIIILLAFNLKLFAQDIHFSQIYLSPLSLNPMHTGNFNGDWRFSNNYRTQWGSIAIPYRTISAGFDKQFYLHKEHFSAGLYILNDNSGHVFLNTTKIFASGAWHKPVNYNNFHIGIQAGYAHKSINTQDATFPNQFDMTQGSFNSTLFNGEDLLNDKLGYFDLNLGIGWTRKFRNFQPELTIGFFHLNYPKETFFPENNRLPLRTVFSAKAAMPFNEKMILTPVAFAMGQRNAANIITGARFDYYVNPYPLFFKGFFAGLYTRINPENPDAVIVQGGLTFKNVEVGLSYDINISGLRRATNSKGAFEIGLIYTGISTIVNKLTIPCERM